jgi:hypothetical protein
MVAQERLSTRMLELASYSKGTLLYLFDRHLVHRPTEC